MNKEQQQPNKPRSSASQELSLRALPIFSGPGVVRQLESWQSVASGLPQELKSLSCVQLKKGNKVSIKLVLRHYAAE